MFKLEAEPGESIGRFIERVKQKCWRNREMCMIGVFNEIELVIHSDSNEHDIVTMYDLKNRLSRYE